MNKDSIGKYIEAFKNEISPYLIPGISLETTIVPILDRVVVCFAFRKNGQTPPKYCGQMGNLDAALRRCGFSNGEAQRGTSADTEVVIQGPRLAIIKDDVDERWISSSAHQDVINIVTHIRTNKK